MKRWPTKPLGEVAEFINGRAFKPGDWSSNGVPIIRIQNLTDPTASANCFEGSFDERHAVRDGDLLVSWSATLDVFVWTRGNAVLNQHIFRAIPHSSQVSKTYLFYALKSVMEELRSKTHGATMKHITKGPFEITRIPVPPLTEQERIVKLLDEVDELRKLRAQADRRTAAFLPALFHEMFGDPATNPSGWPSRKVEEIAVNGKRGVTTGPFGTQLGSRDFTTQGPEVFGIYSLGDANSFRFGGTKRITAQKFKELAKFNVVADDVLISRMGTVGKVCVVPKDAPEGIVSYHLIRVRLNQKECDPQFFGQLLSVTEADGVGLSGSAKGAIMSGINATIVASFRFPVPPLPLQKEFSERVTEIRGVETEQAASRQRLQALFQSLLHRAFSGEL